MNQTTFVGNGRYFGMGQKLSDVGQQHPPADKGRLFLARSSSSDAIEMQIAQLRIGNRTRQIDALGTLEVGTNKVC